MQCRAGIVGLSHKRIGGQDDGAVRSFVFFHPDDVRRELQPNIIESKSWDTEHPRRKLGIITVENENQERFLIEVPNGR
jgi:hypothetical protein